MREITASVIGRGIVLACVQGLKKTAHDTVGSDTQVTPERVFQGTQQDALVVDDDWSSNQHDEQDQHAKVQNGKADDPSLAQFGLLQRVDRGADLTTRRDR